MSENLPESTEQFAIVSGALPDANEAPEKQAYTEAWWKSTIKNAKIPQIQQHRAGYEGIFNRDGYNCKNKGNFTPFLI